MVQSMVEDVSSRKKPPPTPQRSLLIRAPRPGTDGAPDMRLYEAQQGDRRLLCSAGLSTVVPTEEIH